MEEDFYIILSYQGNEYNIEIEDPLSPIEDLINNLITGLELPRTDGTGQPATYYLGRVVGEEEEILQTKVNGEIMNLKDYNVQPGENLTLTLVPIAGSKVPKHENPL